MLIDNFFMRLLVSKVTSIVCVRLIIPFMQTNEHEDSLAVRLEGDF